jgi:hypothetical protein
MGWGEGMITAVFDVVLIAEDSGGFCEDCDGCGRPISSGLAADIEVTNYASAPTTTVTVCEACFEDLAKAKPSVEWEGNRLSFLSPPRFADRGH